jgi:hypothetical protein
MIPISKLRTCRLNDAATAGFELENVEQVAILKTKFVIYHA